MLPPSPPSLPPISPSVYVNYPDAKCADASGNQIDALRLGLDRTKGYVDLASQDACAAQCTQLSWCAAYQYQLEGVTAGRCWFADELPAIPMTLTGTIWFTCSVRRDAYPPPSPPPSPPISPSVYIDYPDAKCADANGDQIDSLRLGLDRTKGYVDLASQDACAAQCTQLSWCVAYQYQLEGVTAGRCWFADEMPAIPMTLTGTIWFTCSVRRDAYPPPSPPPCGSGSSLSSSCGDPITSFQGREMRYWLSTEHFTPVLEQGPYVVSQLAGPANPLPGLEAHKGAWVLATEVDMAGLDKIHIETVDPTTLLLAHPDATVPDSTAPPATADALTTMRLSIGGKQLAAGEHTLSMADTKVAVSAKRDPSKRRIGSGWVEQITITADGLELRITSAKASKFADEDHQVRGLHLDLEFLTFDEVAVRGALPEMWGLQPMSEKTQLLLDEKNVDN